MKVYGYARVSSKDQNLARQMDALATFPVPEEDVFVDKMSGRDFDRPGYQALLRAVAPGDLVVVKSIDRLGRDYDEILLQWRRLTKELGADVVVIDMPLLDTRGNLIGGLTGMLVCDIVLQVLSYVAQIERENIHQRQAEGIASAKARGVQFGRPRAAIPDDFEAVYACWKAGEMGCREAARRLGVSHTTFMKWAHENQEKAC